MRFPTRRRLPSDAVAPGSAASTLASRGHGLAYAVVAIGAVAHLAAKLPIIVNDHGIYWPDEIYQSLEMAHVRVFGYGIVPWEFVEGARNWAWPLLLSVPMKLAVVFAGDDPRTYVLVTRGCFLVLSLALGWQIYSAAIRLTASPLPAALSAAAFLVCGVTLYFSHRALSDVAVQLPTLAGVVLVMRRPRPARDAILGAALLGVATILRLQVALICLTVVIIEAVRFVQSRDRRFEANGLLWLLATFCLFAVAYGGLDAWFYGRHPSARYRGWFHSALVYLRFNVAAGGSAFWGTAPFYYYGSTLLRSLEGLAVVLAIGNLLALRRIPALVWIVALFVAAHSLVPHKELRFILPVMPLMFVAAAVGLSTIEHARVRQIGLAALVAASLVSFVTHQGLTMQSIGAYPERSTDPAFDDFGPVNRLLLRLHREQNVCGVRVYPPLSWAGGSTYLHRRVPIYGGSAGRDAFVNYAIEPAREPAQGTVIAEDGRMSLIYLPDSPCRTDAAYDWVLH